MDGRPELLAVTETRVILVAMAIDEGSKQGEIDTVHEATEETPKEEVVSHGKFLVVAVDGSEEGMEAMEWALKNVVGKGDRVHLLHVQNYFPAAGFGGAGAIGHVPAPELVRSQMKYEEVRAREVVKKAEALCSGKYNVKPTAEILVGDAREAICKRVEAIHPTLLIVGSHGYGAVTRLFLGSVSAYLANHASCPVLVVRSCPKCKKAQCLKCKT